MTHDSAVATHMIIGTLGLLAYWGALLTLKGSPVHRFAGKVTFSLLIVVVLSVGPVLFLLGAIVLAAGLQRGDPVPMVLSWVGLVYGAAMIHFAWTRAPLLPTWWISWHLSAVCGLFTAVHGTLLSVVWRELLAQDAGSWTTAAFHLGVLVIAIAMRLWFGHKRHVPWRFTRAARASQLVA